MIVTVLSWVLCVCGVWWTHVHMLLVLASLITLRLDLSLSPGLQDPSSLASHLVPEILSPPQMLWGYRQPPPSPSFTQVWRI